jgi:arylsulfatase
MTFVNIRSTPIPFHWVRGVLPSVAFDRIEAPWLIGLQTEDSLMETASFSRRQFLRTAVSAGVAGVAASLSGCGGGVARPNILMILADDLGFSDIGCFGGEIKTPHLDRLAKGGTRFTQFYNCARCCPSRASIMTGLYPHRAGIGLMTGKSGDLEGYQGRLRQDAVTIPEALKEAGYSTLMAGKWHLNAPGPVGRGFEEFFGMVHGFDSFWDETKYSRLPEGRPKRSYPPGEFYATNAITDHALDFLGEARKKEKPWFLYLAYNAPHFPLHAPKEVIDSYVPVYEKGWDTIREERFARQQAMKLLPNAPELTPRSIIGPNRVSNLDGTAFDQNPPWDSLDADRRADLSRRMAVFAAMVDVMDRNIGRVLEDLERAGELDNTLIVFFADNGACAEWNPFGFDIQSGPDNILHKGEDLKKMGQPGTYHSYGSAWANASNTPLRLYKHYAFEGGISTPCIVHWPGGGVPGEAIRQEPGHVADLMPTFLDAAKAAYPAERNGAKTLPLAGVSLLPLYKGGTVERDAIFFEHEGNRGVRQGKWKLVALGTGGAWELYDMDADRTEMHNLASEQPERVKAMAAAWEAWAKRDKVVPWPYQPQWGEASPSGG